MTIGIGFSCSDAILLGSDMELTGVAKYKGNKDYFKRFDKEKGVIATVYSGGEDENSSVWEEIVNKLEAAKETELGVTGIRQILSDAVKLRITRKRKFQMLAAIAKDGEQPLFLKVFEQNVYPAMQWDLIGGGDCELSRYLLSLVQHPSNNISQGFLWSSHVINTARNFVQGVGQGVRVTAVYPRGAVRHSAGDFLAETMAQVDEIIGRLWMEFCDTRISQEDFRATLDNVCTRIMHIREMIPPQAL